MADPSDTIDLDLHPDDYAADSTTASAWVEKINKNLALGWSDLRTKVVAQWGNRVDNVERRLQAKLSGVIRNVREYGAVGDGVTDDTAAIQDAIDAATLGGGEVFLPAGTYAVNTTLTYSDDTMIRGQGHTTSIIAFSGSGYTFYNGTPATVVEGVRFESFGITYTAASDGGIYLFDCRDAFVIDVQVTGDANNHGNAFAVSQTTTDNTLRNSIINCFALTCQSGVYLRGQHFGTAVVGSRLQDTTIAIDISDAAHCLIQGNNILTGTTGVQIAATTTAYSDGVMILSNFFSGVTTNLALSGTAANIRYLKIIGNHAADGTTLPAATLLTTVSPRYENNTGSLDNILVISSATTTGPAFRWHATGDVNPVARIIRESGSGTGSTLQLGNAVSGNAALSVGTWSAGTYTQTGVWSGSGTLQTPVASFSSYVTFTGSAYLQLPAGSNMYMVPNNSILLGDGTTAGSSNIIHRHAGASLSSFFFFRNGATSSSTKHGWYYEADDDITFRTYDGSGVQHATLLMELDHSTTEGQSRVNLHRASLNVNAAALTSGAVALSAGWGATASVAVNYGSTNNCEITVTAAGGSYGANPTITITDPLGAWSQGRTIAMYNGGTETGITGFTVADTTTTIVFTMVGTPVGGTYTLRWYRFGQ